jgi:protein O-mannosyl-transferase
MKIARYQVFLLLLVLAILAYVNTMQHRFIWDDELLITDNSCIRNCTYIDSAFTTDLFHNYTVPIASHYRPLQTISYMLDYAIWGLNPSGFHATNMLLHLGCALLVWLLVERLSGNRLLGTLVAVFFTVHPVNTNAVSYIAGRADPLAFAAMLGALLLFIEYRNQPEQIPFVRAAIYTASAICSVTALFSRENACLLPFLVALYCLTLGAAEKHKWRDAILSTLPFLLLALVFGLWRFAVLEMQGKPLHPSEASPAILRVQVFFRALATYLGLLLWPAHLQMERQLILGGIELHVLTATGLLSLVGLGMLMRWAYRNAPLVLFGLSWFLITLLPLMGFPNLNASVAEHWLYVPSVGFYLAVCMACLYLHDHFPALQSRSVRRLATLACVVTVVALVARTIRRNQDWSSPMSLYSRTESSAPYSAGIHCNLAREYINAGKPDQALAELLAAERLEPRDPQARSNLAAFYLSQGDLEKAHAQMEKCLQLDPQNTRALLQFAMISEQRGNPTQARRDYIRALASTMAVQPRIQYGSFLLRHHHLKEALQTVDEAFFLEPGNADVFNLLGAIMSDAHQYQRAEDAFQMARALDRHSPNADINLGHLATLRGDLAAAASSCRRALRIQPNDVCTHYQLAVIHWKRNELELAKQELDSALLLAPNSSVIRETAERVRRGERYGKTAATIPGAPSPES